MDGVEETGGEIGPESEGVTENDRAMMELPGDDSSGPESKSAARAEEIKKKIAEAMDQLRELAMQAAGGDAFASMHGERLSSEGRDETIKLRRKITAWQQELKELKPSA